MFFAACLLSQPASAAGEEIDNPVQFIPQLPKHHPDQIIVRFGQEVGQDVRDEIIAQHDCYVIRTCDAGDVHLLSIPESETAEDMVDNFYEHDDNKHLLSRPRVSVQKNSTLLHS